MFPVLILLLSGMMTVQGLFSQENPVSIRHYGVAEGLIHRKVNTLFQDEAGFIWLGTDFGLSRYDGYEFTNWTSERDQLRNNRINNIQQDDEGYLWLFTNMPSGGTEEVNLFFPKHAKILSLEDKFGPSLPFDPAELSRTCLRGPQGQLYIQKGRQPSFIAYHSDSGFREIPLKGFRDFRLGCISPGGTIWGIADSLSLVEVDTEGKVLKTFRYDNPLHYYHFANTPDDIYFESLPYGFVFYERALSKFSSHELVHFMDFEKGPRKYLPEEWPLYHKQLHPFVFPLILTLAQSNDTAYRSFADLKGQEQDMHDRFPEVGREGIRSVMVDREKRVWAGGRFGIYVMEDLGGERFKKYLYEEKPSATTRKVARGLWVEGDTLIVNEQSHFTHVVNLTTGSSESYQQKSHWGNHGLLKRPGGGFWAGKGNKLTLLEKVEEKEKNLAKLNSQIWAFYHDSQERLWLGTLKGIKLYNPLTKKLLPEETFPELLKTSFAQVSWINSDKEGRLWACTTNGFFSVDFEHKKVQRYGLGESKAFWLPHQDFTHFYQDDEGIFWLTTRGGGLIRWDVETGLTQQFTQKEGLANDILYAVYEDKHAHLWLPSNFGIIRFNKDNFQSRTYLPSDGVSHNEFKRISHFQDETGRLFFGSLNGVTAFHPDDFVQSQAESPQSLQMVRLEVYNNEAQQLQDRSQNFWKLEKIVLNPEDKFIRIRVALLNYEHTDKIQYSYRLVGTDTDWINQKDPIIQPGHLPYGSHTVQIRANDAAGVAAANELLLSIEVLKPFYLQLWFFNVMLFALILLVLLIFRWRTYNLRRQQARLQLEVDQATVQLRRQSQAKSRLFANVSHELRTPLTLVMGPIHSALKDEALQGKSRSYLLTALKSTRQLLRLVNEILDLGKIDSGQLRLVEKPLLLYPFLVRIQQSFDVLAREKSIAFGFDYQMSPDLVIQVDSEKLEIILTNLLSNAFKYTAHDGRIQLRVKYRESLLNFAVEDTGRGIHPEDLTHVFDRYYQSSRADVPLEGGTGIGLALSQEMAGLMDGDIQVESEWGKGTRFCFHMPLKETESDSGISSVITPFSTRDEVDEPPISYHEGGHLLIVEDHPELRAYLKNLLEDDYKVEVAVDGEEALGRLRNSDLDVPDMVLSDVMMPRMDGFALLEHIRQEPGLKGIPVILLTALADSGDKLQALRIGVNDYLTKPFEEEELKARVANLLFWRKLREEERKTLLPSEQEKMASFEDMWLVEVNAWLESNYSSSDVLIMDWAESVHLSESQFRRRLKALAGMTPNQYLQEYRLQKGRHLLEQKAFQTVAEIASATGFASGNYFSKVFNKRFGKSPGQYLHI